MWHFWNPVKSAGIQWVRRIPAEHVGECKVLEVSGFLFSFKGCWAHPLERALLATIRDKGLCPCPRCLVPKSKLDQTGTKHDNKFRLRNHRTYLSDHVLIARNAIYKSAAAIAGAIVNRLLKATSSVPTLVSWVPRYIFIYSSFMFHS